MNRISSESLGERPPWGAAGGEAQASAKPQAATLHGFGRAKACILLYLYGAASQLETFDMKPNAPEGVRGDLKP